MKPSHNSKGSSSHSSCPKPKKSKDRDKKKHSNSNSEKSEERGSSSKDGNCGQYAGIGKDSIRIYAEQTQNLILSDELCTGLAEDISYKLRQLINDALIKARLSGRSFISSSDLDETFENFNVDKVFGATNTPNWLYLPEHNIYYLDDPCENLVEIAESDVSFVQCSRLNINTKWVGPGKDVSPSLKKYFEVICKAVVSNEDNLRMAALRDLQTNHFIGPIIEWLYNFAYFLLSKNVTYDCLTLRGLDLIIALEENPVAMQTVSEKMLKLLTRLLLQRILRSITTLEVLKMICHVIYMFCGRITLREYVLLKVQEKVVDIKNNFPLSMVTLLNSLGKEAIIDILVPHMDYFIVEMKNHDELVFALLATLSIIQEDEVSSKFKDYELSLVPLYKIIHQNPKIENLELNWLKVKMQLFKSRRKLDPSANTSRSKPRVRTLGEVFSEYQELKQINIVFHKIEARNKNLLPEVPNWESNPRNQNNDVIIGKYSLSYKHGYYLPNTKKCCYDHTLYSCSY